MSRELEIVNACLLEINLASVDSVDETDEDIRDAVNIINRENRKLQTKNWWFNTTIQTLEPNTSNEIYIPANTSKVDPVDPRKQYAVIGNRLFDTSNNTYTIENGVECKVTYIIDVESIPTSAFDHLLAKVLFEFYRVKGQADNRAQLLNLEVVNTSNMMMSEHLKHKQYNSRNNQFVAEWLRYSRVTRSKIYRG